MAVPHNLIIVTLATEDTEGEIYSIVFASEFRFLLGGSEVIRALLPLSCGTGPRVHFLEHGHTPDTSKVTQKFLSLELA